LHRTISSLFLMFVVAQGGLVGAASSGIVLRLEVIEMERWFDFVPPFGWLRVHVRSAWCPWFWV
jgi:hypothetical protein